jgi:hypothetical protein
MKDERKDGFEDGNWVEKSKTQKSLGVIKNIEDFDHNSAENADFDDGTNLKIQNAAPESIR